MKLQLLSILGKTLKSVVLRTKEGKGALSELSRKQRGTGFINPEENLLWRRGKRPDPGFQFLAYVQEVLIHFPFCAQYKIEALIVSSRMFCKGRDVEGLVSSLWLCREGIELFGRGAWPGQVGCALVTLEFWSLLLLLPGH